MAEISYEGSYQRLDGGWDKIILVLPAEATDAQIEAGIATWQRIRERALPALKAANPLRDNGDGTADQVAASPDLVLTFGKYRGRTVRDVLAIDPGYVEWLALNANAEVARRSARMALGQRDEATAPEHEEEIPF